MLPVALSRSHSRSHSCQAVTRSYVLSLFWSDFMFFAMSLSGRFFSGLSPSTLRLV